MTTSILLRNKVFFILLTSLILSISIQSKVHAGGNLVVTPTRIVFSDRIRSERVTLLNTGTESASYRISFVRRNMLEDGNLIEIKEGEKGNYSDTLIRYSPRQVTLPPGQSQVIRLMLRKPRNLTDGEYRSHMLFQALPKPKNNIIGIVENKETDTISIQITPLIGITIPVIVRHGELQSSLKINNPAFNPATKKIPFPRISIGMNRTGNKSTYGDFKIRYTPEGETSSFIVAQVKGVAVYTPNTKRTFSIRLTQPPGINFTKGIFNIAYTEADKKIKVPLTSEIDLSIP